MPAMKRPAAASAPPAKVAKVVEPAKKAVKAKTPDPVVIDPFTAKCDIVIAALKASEKSSATEMLITMLPLAAQPPPRHKFQENALDFVDQMLRQEMDAMKSEVAELHASVAGVDDERTRRVAAVPAAVADVPVKSGVYAEAQIFLATQNSVLKDAKTAAAAARAAQKVGDAELDGAAERELTITSAVERKAALETAQPAEESSIKARAEKLCKDCQLVIEDAGLLKAVSMSLSKLPDARASFDKMVLAQFSEEMAKHLAAAQKLIAEGEPSRAARAADVQKCDAAQKTANDAQMSAFMAESDAEVAKGEAEVAVKTATEALAGLAKEVENAAVEVLAATKRLAEFETGPMATFAALRDPSTAVETEVEPAAKGEEKAVGDGAAVTEDVAMPAATPAAEPEAAADVAPVVPAAA